MVFDSRRIAWADSGGNVRYQFADALGSTRAVTTSSGTTCFNTDYYPYGQENDYTTTCSPTYRFTGYEFDSETGNDYAYARYYDPRLGRFLSADPLDGGLPATGGAMSGTARLRSGGFFPPAAQPLALDRPLSGGGGGACHATAAGNPQAFNRYSYVANNPGTLIDPSGALIENPPPPPGGCDPSLDPFCECDPYSGACCDPGVDPDCIAGSGGGGSPAPLRPPLANCYCSRRSKLPSIGGRCSYNCKCGAGVTFFAPYNSVESYTLSLMVRYDGCKLASNGGKECPPYIESGEINIGDSTSYWLKECSTGPLQ